MKYFSSNISQDSLELHLKIAFILLTIAPVPAKNYASDKQQKERDCSADFVFYHPLIKTSSLLRPVSVTFHAIGSVSSTKKANTFLSGMRSEQQRVGQNRKSRVSDLASGLDQYSKGRNGGRNPTKD